MFVKVLTGAVLASVLGAFGALAQSAGDIGGPRELPPPGFAGQQYVDSRGCVFLRAGMAGRVNWVPRVDRDRRPMCGYPPSTGGRMAAGAVAEAPAPAPAPVAVAKPAPVAVATPAPAPRRVAAVEPPASSYVPAPVRMAPMTQVAPMAQMAPVVVPQAPQRGQGQGRIACTTAAPVAQRLPLTNGGSVVVCSRGDGTLEGLRAPIYPPGSGVGASLSRPDGGRNLPLGQPSGMGPGKAEARVAQHSPAVPKGYRLAWEDDRLNPLRGVGTAEGQAAQDQVWTRELPARQQVEQAPQVTRSTKSAPAEAVPKAAGGRFVQVGSFGVPANAAGASARLAALGLPVAMSKGRIGGKAVQVVLAGPFDSAADAQAALRAARGAGFADAFLR